MAVAGGLCIGTVLAFLAASVFQEGFVRLVGFEHDAMFHIWTLFVLFGIIATCAVPAISWTLAHIDSTGQVHVGPEPVTEETRLLMPKDALKTDEPSDCIKRMYVCQSLLIGFTRVFLKAGVESACVVTLHGTFTFSASQICALLILVNGAIVGQQMVIFSGRAGDSGTDSYLNMLSYAGLLFGLLLMGFASALLSIQIYIFGYATASLALALSTTVMNASGTKYTVEGSCIFNPKSVIILQMLTQNMLGRGFGPPICSAVFVLYGVQWLSAMLCFLCISSFCVAEYVLPKAFAWYEEKDKYVEDLVGENKA
eukprot:TRINITY_DN110914_c0_g1_i1.p1 TRINITY_DN110914_c0_g1~~TRINITY_DN110914_c0_g1_i1.p1  ORF type:complete len:344 (-),score=59.11 TRINITY_DN110914_c0_g1_i1:176-1111(-)